MTVVNTGDNRYGVAQFIVAPTIAEGANYTTIASAITAAVSGQTIFIRPGTYTENLTLKAGVSLTAFGCDASQNATGHVIISGTCTLTTAGSVTISGIQLQTNSAALLAITGSVASIVNLNNCYLNCTNATGITFSSSSASAALNIMNCMGNLGTTGISYISHSSAGSTLFEQCLLENSGASVTANTVSAGILNFRHTTLSNPITVSGTGIHGFFYSDMNTAATNTTCLTAGGSGSQQAFQSSYAAGSASAITISTTLNVFNCVVASTNTNAITGAGTLNFNNVVFSQTSNTINTTTQTSTYSNLGSWRATAQPAFLATSAGAADVTGDGTVYTVTFANEIFDQKSNFASNTFTAPVTGRYQLNVQVSCEQLGASHTVGEIILVTSNRSYRINRGNYATMRDLSANAVAFSGSVLADMDVNDTATVTLTVFNSTKTVDVSATVTTFSGFLMG